MLQFCLCSSLYNRWLLTNNIKKKYSKILRNTEVMRFFRESYVTCPTVRCPGVGRAASDRWTVVIPELRKFWDDLCQIHVAKSYWEFPGPGKRAARSAFMIGLSLTPQITVMRFANNVDWFRTRFNFKITTTGLTAPLYPCTERFFSPCV